MDNAMTERLGRLGFSSETQVCFEPFAAHAADSGFFDNVTGRTGFYLAAREYALSVIYSFIERGVDFTGFDGVLISPFAEIGAGTVIHPGTQIRSGVKLGRGCVVGPNSVIERSTIGDGCTVNATQIYDSTLEDNVKIGPFCHIRPNSHICSGVKIGDFVEVKNSVIGRDTHASHLTYIGDSDVGERVNFGCGVVTVNYDGKHKHRTVIGNDAFIGCNTNLVAPVTLSDRAYTAAGSTITDDVPEASLGIARARQVVINGWVERKNARDSAADK